MLIHGAGRDWQVGIPAIEGVRHRPISGLSPALWKSSPLLAAAEARAGLERLLAEAASLRPYAVIQQENLLRLGAADTP